MSASYIYIVLQDLKLMPHPAFIVQNCTCSDDVEKPLCAVVTPP